MKEKKGKIFIGVIVFIFIFWITDAKTKIVLWQATNHLNEVMAKENKGGTADYDWKKTITVTVPSGSKDDNMDDNPLAAMFINAFGPKIVQTAVCQKDEAVKILDYGATIRFKVMSSNNKVLFSAMVNKESCYN